MHLMALCWCDTGPPSIKETGTYWKEPSGGMPGVLLLWELGLLGLEGRLGGILAMSRNPCGEEQRGRSPALGSGAQCQDWRQWARPGARQVPCAHRGRCGAKGLAGQPPAPLRPKSRSDAAIERKVSRRNQEIPGGTGGSLSLLFCQCLPWETRKREIMRKGAEIRPCRMLFLHVRG